MVTVGDPGINIVDEEFADATAALDLRTLRILDANLHAEQLFQFRPQLVGFAYASKEGPVVWLDASCVSCPATPLPDLALTDRSPAKLLHAKATLLRALRENRYPDAVAAWRALGPGERRDPTVQLAYAQLLAATGAYSTARELLVRVRPTLAASLERHRSLQSAKLNAVQHQFQVNWNALMDIYAKLQSFERNAPGAAITAQSRTTELSASFAAATNAADVHAQRDSVAALESTLREWIQTLRGVERNNCEFHQRLTATYSPAQPTSEPPRD